MSTFRFGRNRFQDLTAIRRYLQQNLVSMQPGLQSIVQVQGLVLNIEIAQKPGRLVLVWRYQVKNRRISKQLPDDIYNSLVAFINAYDNFFVYRVPSQAKRPQVVTMELRINDLSQFAIRVEDDDRDPHFNNFRG